jgi:Asp-tRNA(Asn)/Glu-tRNA(Gln) amidotransferase A subunit family amidase
VIGLAALAAAVQSGATTAEALVVESLRRIDAANPLLNAVVARRDELALAEAKALDARVSAGESVGPLAGIPLLVKDLEDVSGMVTTKGSIPFSGAAPAESDGLTPERLRAAGAIVVGKSNLPEFAIEGFSANLLFGATRNPWAPEWSPGGSSGGSAAALAAGLAPIATATDGGGSIRIPAGFCGLVGLKPTRGAIGRRPIPDWIDLSTDGPFATSVADLRLLFSIMVGPVSGDPESWGAGTPPQLGRPSHLLAARRTADLGPLPEVVNAGFTAAAMQFADLVGLPIRWLTAREVFPVGNPDTDWFIIAAAEHVAGLGREWIRENFELLHPASQEFLTDGMAVGIDAYLGARRRRFEYARTLDEHLGPAGLLLSPTSAVAGLPADGRLDDSGRLGATSAEYYSTAVQNLTGHPAISVPAGRCPNGVPFGLQLTGPRGSDTWLLDLAALWEQSYPWSLVAPGYEVFGAGLPGLN